MVMAVALLMLAACSSKQEEMKKELTDFIRNHDSVLIPLYKESALASWQANITGKDEDYQKSEALNLRMMALYSDKGKLEKLERIQVSGTITDSLLLRQLNVLLRSFLMAKADTAKLNEMVRMGTAIEQKYGNFRTVVRGKELSDNEVEDVLRNSRDVKYQQEVWEAQKKIGTVVADDIRKLVKLRNKVAEELGFKNYHEMSLTLSDQKPRDVSKLFSELDTLTGIAFAQVKGEIDNYFVSHYNLKSTDELRPWNYQNRFFQEAPGIYDVDLDVYYRDKNLETLTSSYFAGLGLPVDDMMKNSDLYEKQGKNQHAFCIDIDNAGDVRVLCNIKPDQYWMNTMLHEFGHAVYDKNIDTGLPFILRDPAHTFTTEAIAMIFGRFSSNPQWLKDVVGISEPEKAAIAGKCHQTLRLEQLVFSRWAQVMYRFEKKMYENPDQDLNSLWWDLVEKYQLLKRPEGRNEPDWATKIHIATYPCYYHNYLLGELLASQLYYYIVSNVIRSEDFENQSFAGKPEVGAWLKEQIFQPGNRWYWDDLIEKSTGEKLTAKYYARQFVD